MEINKELESLITLIIKHFDIKEYHFTENKHIMDKDVFWIELKNPNLTKKEFAFLIKYYPKRYVK